MREKGYKQNSKLTLPMHSDVESIGGLPAKNSCRR